MTEEPKDEGAPLLVVRLSLPTAAVVDSFPPAVRDQIRINIEKVRRWFRGRTLPLPGLDGRLYPDGWSVDLSIQVNHLLLDGITDETARETLNALPLKKSREVGHRVYMTFRNTEEPQLEMHYAGQLLGKHWYRHQEPTIFDAVEWVKEIRASRARGDAPTLKPLPPAPPRR